MVTVKVKYPHGSIHNTEVSFVGIISTRSALHKRLKISDILNKLFDGEHDKIFGKNKYLVAGDVEHITINYGSISPNSD